MRKHFHTVANTFLIVLFSSAAAANASTTNTNSIVSSEPGVSGEIIMCPFESEPNARYSGNSKLDTMYCHSKMVGVFVFERIVRPSPYDLTNGLIGELHEEKLLRGSNPGTDLLLRYQHVPGTHFKEAKKRLPAIGSRWIIFLEQTHPQNGALNSYHEAEGRQEASEANLGELYKVIELHRGQQ